MSNCSTYLISIHAAREGGDPRPRQPQGKRSISIHAAREGGDDDGYAKDIAQGVFQSTPPVKAATHNAHHFYPRQTNFNPRRP